MLRKISSNKDRIATMKAINKIIKEVKKVPEIKLIIRNF